MAVPTVGTDEVVGAADGVVLLKDLGLGTWALGLGFGGSWLVSDFRGFRG